MLNGIIILIRLSKKSTGFASSFIDLLDSVSYFYIKILEGNYIFGCLKVIFCRT